MKIHKLNRYLELEEIPQMVEIFLAKGEEKELAKGEYFLREGQKCDYIGYVQRGGFRHLKEASDGTERIAGYSFEGDFVTNFTSGEGEGSAISLQAMRDSTVYLLSKKEIYSHQTWEYRFKVAQVSLADVYGRLLLMHVGTAEERYLNLIAYFPAILNEVPLKEIASFLRMTPETLSRIRKKILSNENS
ncbi:MAG: Crp/Fnr family transcriptional regulator [Alistipes sp.]|jgi:CRP-like cAMP-binding protein|nr:Crp/Fnr family transcriptional regulator [Alistipes sp.]